MEWNRSEWMNASLHPAWVPTMGAVDALARVSRVTPPRGEARRLGVK